MADNKQELLMHSLTNFFTIHTHYNDLIPILKGKSKASLRIIDWFVTNYSKDINFVHPETNQPFMIYDHYKSQLRAYSKKQFDPFCRRTRINFYYTPTDKIITTVGQLNFFRWAIENNVIKYIVDNFDSIENAMKQYSKNNRTKKNIHRENKKKYKSSKRNVMKYNHSVLLSFE